MTNLFPLHVRQQFQYREWKSSYSSEQYRQRNCCILNSHKRGLSLATGPRQAVYLETEINLSQALM